jgi:hypothetical protein
MRIFHKKLGENKRQSLMELINDPSIIRWGRFESPLTHDDIKLEFQKHLGEFMPLKFIFKNSANENVKEEAKFYPIFFKNSTHYNIKGFVKIQGQEKEINVVLCFEKEDSGLFLFFN